MGTNYYALHALDDLATAGTVAEVEVRHLGKLSAGWLPTLPYDTVDEWFGNVIEASAIRDEYGRHLNASELVGRFVLHARRNSNGLYQHDGTKQVAMFAADCVGRGEFT